MKHFIFLMTLGLSLPSLALYLECSPSSKSQLPEGSVLVGLPSLETQTIQTEMIFQKASSSSSIALADLEVEFYPAGTMMITDLVAIKVLYTTDQSKVVVVHTESLPSAEGVQGKVLESFAKIDGKNLGPCRLQP